MYAPAFQQRAPRRARHFRKPQPERSERPNPAAGAATSRHQSSPTPFLRGHAGKKPYLSRKEAEAVIAGRDQRTALRFHPLNAYQCRLCGWWHIGHNRRQEPACLPPPAPIPAPAG